MRLVPGEKASAIVRVIEEPATTTVSGKKLTVAKVSDGERIANLIAWDDLSAKLRAKKDDILVVKDGVCPKSHRDSPQPPTIEIAEETSIEKTDLVFPSVKECMRTTFLAEAEDYSYVVAEGFIVRAEEEKPKMQGFFADGTETLEFKAVSERVSKKIASRGARNKAHRVLGYVRGNTLHLEELL